MNIFIIIEMIQFNWYNLMLCPLSMHDVETIEQKTYRKAEMDERQRRSKKTSVMPCLCSKLHG